MMDKTEAKDILDYDIRQYIRHCEDATDQDFEALDLAIEALEHTGIVRCKDCIYCNVVNTKYAYAYCMKHGFTFYPFQDDTRTNYCSWGEALKEPTGDYEFFGGTYAKDGDAESATTTDCISRQQAIEALTGWETEPLDEDIVRTLNNLPPVTPPKKVVAQISIDTEELIERIKAESIIEQAPSVTPTERPRGEWEKTEHSINENVFEEWIEIRCPFCGHKPVYENIDDMEFCPNCGADMRGEQDG